MKLKQLPRKRVYVAGPMTGMPEFNFPAFDSARDFLKQTYDVISPADLDREQGFDPTLYGDCCVVSREFLDAAIRRDVIALMSCDAIYLLRGWEKSKGACAELALAKWMNLEILEQLSTAPTTVSKESILEEAIRITSGERRRDYDKASSNHKRIAGAWNWYIRSRKNSEAELSAFDVAMLMMLLKVARACFTPTRDSMVDCAGYAKCGSQIMGFESE